MNRAPADIEILFHQPESKQAIIHICGRMEDGMHIDIFHVDGGILNKPQTLRSDDPDDTWLTFHVRHEDALVIVVYADHDVTASAIFDIRTDLSGAIGAERCSDHMLITQCDSTVYLGIQKALARHQWQKMEVA